MSDRSVITEMIRGKFPSQGLALGSLLDIVESTTVRFLNGLLRLPMLVTCSRLNAEIALFVKPLMVGTMSDRSVITEMIRGKFPSHSIFMYLVS